MNLFLRSKLVTLVGKQSAILCDCRKNLVGRGRGTPGGRKKTVTGGAQKSERVGGDEDGGQRRGGFRTGSRLSLQSGPFLQGRYGLREPSRKRKEDEIRTKIVKNAKKRKNPTVPIPDCPPLPPGGEKKTRGNDKKGKGGGRAEKTVRCKSPPDARQLTLSRHQMGEGGKQYQKECRRESQGKKRKPAPKGGGEPGCVENVDSTQGKLCLALSGNPTEEKLESVKSAGS